METLFIPLLSELLHQTGLSDITPGNLVMIMTGLILLYLGIVKKIRALPADRDWLFLHCSQRPRIHTHHRRRTFLVRLPGRRKADPAAPYFPGRRCHD